MNELLYKLKAQGILLAVVDEKLKVFASDANPDPSLIAEVKAKTKELLQFLSNADQSGFNDSYSIHIPATPEASHYPLSSSQEMLWVVCQHEQSNVGYNIRNVYVFEGQLDLAALSLAFNNLLKRHEILRTVFREDKQGAVRQFVRTMEDSRFEIGYIDLRKEADREGRVSQLLRSASLTPFDLAESPLLRADCWQIEDNRWVFSYVMHHIISDGWTMEVLIRELLQSYNSTLRGDSDDRPPLRIQYRDYVAWLQQQLSGAGKRAHEAYWLQQFNGDLPVLALDGDKPRPALKTYNGEEVLFRIDSGTTKRINALCKEQGATLFMGLLAAVTALLNKFTGQEDIVIGTPIAGRGHADLEDQIGYYVNTLALRMQFSRKDDYRAMLEMAKQVTLGAYEHQLYPFGELIEALHMQRDMSRNPLFDVQVILGQSSMLKVKDNAIAGGLQVRRYEGEQTHTSRFDIVFNFLEAGDELLLGILYNSDVYSHEVVTRLGTGLQQLMADIAMRPEATIGLLDCLHANEKQQILTDFNSELLEYPNNQTVLDLFNRQVLLHPDHPALVFEGESHTYRQLDDLSNQLAGYLKKNYVITGNDLIGIMVDRSDKMIIGILGILKSGAAYVPVDPDYPQARREFIIRDTEIKVLLTQSDYLFDLDYYDGAIFALDIQLDMPDVQLVPSMPDPSHLAYIIYTSGSTGNPKGVLIDHGNLMHSLAPRMEIYPVVQSFLLMSSYAFDSSIAGIFGTLCTGGTLCIIKKTDTTNAPWIADYIVKNGISHLLTVPSLYQVLLSELANKKNALAAVIVAGETCSVQLVNYHYSLPVMQDCVLYNEYGPTEGSVWSSVYKYEKGLQPFLTIGKPIHNTQMYILRDGVSVLPVGVPGEICIGGRGVARGYLNQPELTSKKFVTNPFKAGERMYRTGDLGKWLPDGNIVFIGRVDDQVKIRGYRVELGEVENALQTHTSIDAAIVVARSDKEGSKELAAFVIGRDNLTVSDIRGHIGRILPEHAIPAHFIQLDRFPLTPNGKVDRKKLLQYTGEGISGGTEYIAPQNETEAKLAEVWEDILGKEKIGIRNSFFEMGGDSIKILRMVAAVRKKLDMEIPVAEVYKHNTIESILMHVLQHKEDIGERREVDNAMRSAVIAQMDVLKTRVLSYDHIRNKDNIEDVYPMSDIEKGMVYESLLNDGYNVYHDQMIHQRVFPAFDITRFRLALQLLVEKHAILRTSFDVSDFEQPVQLVHRTIAVDVHYADLSGTGSKEQEDTIRSFLRSELQRPFDTTKAPLWRMAAFNIGDNRIVFVSQCHHAIIDGWSDALFMTELNNLYLHLADDPTYKPVKLRSDYKDFVIRQEMDKMDASVRTFWKEELDGFKKPDLFTNDNYSGRYHFVPDSSIVKKLEGRAGKLDTSIKAISLSAFLYLLKVLSDDEEIVAGVVTNTRPDCEDGDKILGCFLNTIPLRMEISSDEKCTALTRRVYNKLIALKDKERLSLLEIARLHTEGTGNPFFDVIFNYVDFHAYSEIENEIPGGNAQQAVPGIAIAGNGTTNTFLDLTVNMTGGRFSIGITMGKRMKCGFTPEQIGNLYMTILSFIADPADRVLNTIELVGEVERQQLLTAFNPTLIKTPDAPATIVELFEEQAAGTPDLVALAYRDRTMTYRALNEQSNHLANHLRQTYHIKSDDLIGVKLERSERLIITILAILKSGGAYMPVDPGNPQERIDYMIKESRCQLFIDESWLNDYDQLLKAGREENKPIPTNDPIRVNQPSNLAYVIFTSGSTGKPKGVLVEHRSVVNLIVAQRSAFGINREDNVLQASDVSFDASVEQIFIALTSGARLTMIDKDVLLEAEKLEAFIDDHQITHVHLVPGILAMLPVKKYTWLKRVIAGGDTCPKDLAERWSVHHPFYNEYGPTETTVTSIMHLYDLKNKKQSFVPVGRPLPNTIVYILKNDRLAPAGVIGEICIGGVCLARGYLNRPDYTQATFVPNPFREGEKMYRTGDLGRWLAGGNIEFAGRIDNQVKIRGYRIETGEIESALQTHPDIAASVVARTIQKGEPELIAYIVGRKPLSGADLRSHLGRTLPGYMLPSHYVQIEEIPLSPNGKIDRKKLPDPVGAGIASGTVLVHPRNLTEFKLVRIWQEILGRETISVMDNFFELGGHSLKATRLANQIHKAFDVRIALKDLFAKSWLEEQAQLIDQAQKTTFTRIAAAADWSDYVLSSSQRRLWVMSQFEEANAGYNIPAIYRFEGRLDRLALEASFRRLIVRHEILRTVFRENRQGEIRQFIQSPEMAGFRLLFEELHKEEVAERVQAAVNEPFDLATGPLIRASLFQVTDDEWVFFINMHHIISDGTSMVILIDELLQLYKAQTSGQPDPLLPLRIQYKDYAAWQQEQLNSNLFDIHKAWWLDQLGGDLPVLELPVDRPRPPVKTYKGGVVKRVFSAGQYESIKSLSREQGGTLFMGLLALVNTLLHRYTGQEDIIIGSPIAGREHADLEDQIGFYVNTLALRTRFCGEDSYKTLLENIRQGTFSAYEHQAYPFDELVNDLYLQRDMSRSALFDVMVVLQNTGSIDKNKKEHVGELRMSGYQGGEHLTSKFDLLFNFTEEEGGLAVFIEYNSDLFDSTTACRIGDHLVQLLGSVIEDPSLPIRQLDYLRPAEKDQLLHAFNDTAFDCSHARTVIDLLEEQVSRTPTATVLVVGGKRFSYREVNEWSNRLAAKILEQGSVRRGDSVGVLLERSEWSVFAMIGIMKLGCVYVPIDAALPASRIRYMLEASGSILLITQRSANNNYPAGVAVITVDEVSERIDASNPAMGITGPETAYIIYTSGSTGDPKGVEQTHLTLYNLIIWSIEGARFDTGTRQLQFSSFSFDMSLYDIYYAFATGGEVHLISDELRSDPWALKAYVIGAEITTLSMPYSALKALFSAIGSEEWAGHRLREIISAGEQLYVSGGLMEFLTKNPELRIYNLYGPSETHVVTGISYSYSKGPIPEKAGIGKPVYNTVIYILDKEMQLVPPGVEGEIYIGGGNLAKGYIGRADLTAEKFIPDPFRHGELVYRSGDIGKWLPGGGIEYIRRRDDQLKINGYRIELGEIEQALRRHDQVSEAIVVARTNAQGDKSLVAYIVRKSTLNSNETRNYLTELLPVYMLPDYYVQLEKLPLTRNGKVDKRALPDPEGLGMATGVEYIAPAGEIELKLEAIWSEVLGLEKGRISTGDNFFTLGGNSIKATRLVSKIRKDFNVMVALKDVFLEPSIAGFATGLKTLLWVKKAETVEQKDAETEWLIF